MPLSSSSEKSVQRSSPLDISLPVLTLESTLQDLPLHAYQIESFSLGKEAVQIFEENLLLPGIILTDQGKLAGMISRRRFLEEMSRPYGLDLFLHRPLQVLYSFTNIQISVFPGDTLIATAANAVLRRSPEHLNEPVVVQLSPHDHRLLDVYQLLVAQSQVHSLACQLLDEKNQAQILQAEKMASLGRMVAGVAHEIFNPVNFISGNIGYLSDYIRDLTKLLAIYEAELESPSTQITNLRDAIGIDFVLQDLPRILDSMKLGTDRLKGIAGSLRNFSHMNENDRKLIDIHSCIDNTLIILNSRLKKTIEITKNYGEIPLIDCHFGPMSQVFMNIIGNAIDALMEKASRHSKDQTPNSQSSPHWEPRIVISTSICSDRVLGKTEGDRWVSIKISDNGPGIPDDIQNRIFETFFTTKPVGEGTGLGLTISHQIITEKHGGKIHLKSKEGVGTEFQILLPLNVSS